MCLCLFLGLCSLVLLCCVGFCGCVDVPMVGMGSDWAAGAGIVCSLDMGLLVYCWFAFHR